LPRQPRFNQFSFREMEFATERRGANSSEIFPNQGVIDVRFRPFATDAAGPACHLISALT